MLPFRFGGNQTIEFRRHDFDQTHRLAIFPRLTAPFDTSCQQLIMELKPVNRDFHRPEERIGVVAFFQFITGDLKRGTMLIEGRREIYLRLRESLNLGSII